MELTETLSNYIDVLWHLRYIIAVPFVILGSLSAWGWWKGVTV